MAVMGLRYFAGKSWSEITREERVFCLHLYLRARDFGPNRFVQYFNDHLGLRANPDANWEIAYEVCLYRDLWHHRGRQGSLFSPKRTFDLCLFSDDHIIVIEAKAQQPFDDEQVRVFARDKAQIVRETGVARASLLGVGSSRCAIPATIQASFDAPIMTWRELARVFDDDAILYRADDVYEEPSFSPGKNNASGRMTGAEILQAHADGRQLFVGREGGVDGARFREDVESQRWRVQTYETNDRVVVAPNKNWFSIDQFVARVK
jgi:hypothetical protein